MLCRKCQREMPSDALYCPYCGAKIKATANKHKPRTRPNGAGTAYKRGKAWYAQVTVYWKAVEEDGAMKHVPVRRTKGGFKSRREALEYCQVLKKSPSASKPRQTMQQIYDAWLPTHEGKVGKSTMDCYKAAYKYLAPLYYVPFADINVDDLQECIDNCPQGKRTKENIKALAGLLMKYAIPRHYTDMNYAQFLHTGNDTKGTRPAFTPDQVEAIREQVGITPYADYVYVLIYTGFRPSELFILKKSDLRGGILYGGIKTEAGKDRAVPVSSKIRPILEKRLVANSEWLFPRDDGSQMTVSYFRDTYFYQVLDAAGIQPMPTPEHPAVYVPYSCRHTFANLLKNAPGSDKDKAGLIGHEDYKTTKKHYQSEELDAMKAIIDAL